VIGLWLPVALWMGAIYWGAATSSVPSAVKDISDTIMHMSAYSGLALLSLRAVARGRWSGVTMTALVIAFVIAVAHGLSVEWEQMFIPERVAEWRDVGNDVIGALAGLAPAWAWSKIRGRNDL
jgi:VanZ family protein